MNKYKKARRYIKLLRSGVDLGLIMASAICTVITVAAFWEMYRSGRPGHGNALFLILLLPLTFYLGWFARRTYTAVRRELYNRAKQRAATADVDAPTTLYLTYPKEKASPYSGNRRNHDEIV